MDSAAAYSMTLPDEGAARWAADCALAAVVRPYVGVGAPRNVFRIHSMSGTGTARVSWGDGTSADVPLPGSASHEYSSSGSFLVTVTGSVSDVRLSDGQAVGATELDAAPRDVLRITCPIPTLALPHMPETGLLVAFGVNVWYRHASGGYPKRIVLRAVSGSLRLENSVSYSPVFNFGLEEFYAPGATGFSGHPYGSLGQYRPPFGGCASLKVLYLPSITTIPFVSFVSPSAVGVKVYVGRLTSVNASAFSNSAGTISGPSASGCRAELFCQNTETEARNLGFPFGAAYLKCHCTDATFDSDGWYYRADGRRVDSDGRLRDDQGRFVNEAGHLIKFHEGLNRWILCDQYGFYVDEDDRPIDPVTGFWIDRSGHVCDEYGRKCDTLGNLVSEERYWTGADGWVECAGEQAEVDRIGTLVGEVRSQEMADPSDPAYGLYTDQNGNYFYDGDGYLRLVSAEVAGAADRAPVVYDGDRAWHVDVPDQSEEVPL